MDVVAKLRGWGGGSSDHMYICVQNEIHRVDESQASRTYHVMSGPPVFVGMVELNMTR